MALTLSYPDGGALIIGGTGRVGEGITRQMAKADVPLVFTHGGRSEARAIALERELREAGHDVTRQQLDFRDAAAIAQAIQSVVDRHGRLHSLLCGGSPEVPFAKMADFKPEEIDRFFEYDALAHFRLYREAVLAMRQTGGGSITVCTTIANSRIIDYDGISAISKAAVESISKQIAAEEGAYGIRCNTVQISWTAAEKMEETLQHLPRPDKTPETYTEMMASMLNDHWDRSRLKRNSQPEEAGFLFAFLASDQASYLTGQSLVFDGGITL
jgi:NAD(P)-dependent dehydrogenase (short-subunit alcohol dehydrogenase family)